MPSKEEIEKRVLEFYGYALAIARNIGKRTPSEVNVGDLESAALLGLLKASLGYDKGKTAFKTYAMLRIRGEVLDFLRTPENYSRRLKKKTHINHSLDMPSGFDEQGVAYNIFAETLSYYNKDVKTMENLEHAKYCIAKLPEQMQQVIEDVRDELTLAESGKKMGVSKDRVSQLRVEARRLLRKEWYR